MLENAEIKGFFVVFSAVITYLYGSFSELLVSLLLFMIFDYISGIFVAFKSKCFHPNDGLFGAMKKLFYGVLVACGFLADFIVNYMTHKVGVQFHSPGFLGIAVTLYLIANEGLSVFRNLILIGVPVPPFLISWFGYLKDESGQIVKMPGLQCKPRKGRKKHEPNCN